MLKITDPRFVYINSALTNIRATIEKERARIRAEAAAKAASGLEVQELTQEEADAILDRQDFEARR